MKTLNFKLAALIRNLFNYALVYGMEGICDICQNIIGRDAIIFDDVKSLRWACSSVRRRLVRDLESDHFERIFKFGDKCIYSGLVDMTKLEIELDLL